ncbi:SDR family NAD(P)-dependent oxidoreductase [Frankia gtarii]|uniref:SDR family NAD(P)-dependent oxidoreductase n=1 Tax=Frankia gtarii TaxID=2950102 RepID=UPI0021C24860|nr:SDR family NAD(P)-dependent oxidoreductase [Frankia gtarii]
MSEQTIALVTDANKGIGYEIAAGLGALGWRVGVGARDEQRREAETGPIGVAYAPSKTFLNAVTVQYAKELHDTNILINAACPGYTATDLNGFRGVRTPQQGAAIAIRLATLTDDGPTGGFFDDAGTVSW